jgi:predicted DNA-binding transcriptional regulator AlpA
MPKKDATLASQSTEGDPFLTTNEVAQRYRTEPSTVRYWRHVGSGPNGVKIGRRVLYRESELVRWERERASAAADGGAAA